MLELITTMSESLLEKYPHLKLLTQLKKKDIVNPTPSRPASGLEEENISNRSSEGRISLLGPGVGIRSPLVPLHPPPLGGPMPRTKVYAEDLFAASMAADDDQWLQFQVEEAVPAKQQLDQLKMWLVANRPSTVTRSSGVGWIAVKFKDKGKKVLEAKAAWDNTEGEKGMELVNQLAEQFHVMGGKWLCHLPTDQIDQVWSKLATTLMCGGLGPSEYMVKVSPVQDIQPEQSRGEHVICVYNTNYKDTEQVMRVENLLRSAGVTTVLTYKPDIFSALGIYRNNKWGFRPTIYSSRVMLMEGKSRVETVGTGDWYYNSSKGLQYPTGMEVSKDEDVVKGVGKENKAKDGHQEEVKINKSDDSREKSGKVKEFGMGKIDDKTTHKTNLGANLYLSPEVAPHIQLAMKSLDDMKSDVPSVPGGKNDPFKKIEFCIEDMEAMKLSSKSDSSDAQLKQISDKNSMKKGAKMKKNQKKVDASNDDEKISVSDCPKKVLPHPKKNNGKDKHESKARSDVKPSDETKNDIVEEVFAEVKTVTDIVVDTSKPYDQKKLSCEESPSNCEKSTTRTPIASSSSKKSVKQAEQAIKPAWLLKLQQLQMKSLDEMSKNE